jgi:hypothetical protein
MDQAKNNHLDQNQLLETHKSFKNTGMLKVK